MMKTVIFFLIAIFSSIVNASHPLCSDEEGHFKFITSREENLTPEYFDKVLAEIKALSEKDIEEEYDDIVLGSQFNYIGLYFEKKRIYKMLKEKRAISEERKKSYCRAIGRNPKNS